jgi:hypothetical protein
LEVVELHKMGLLCFPEFNQYVVGFDNPSYPQNYPQKTLRVVQNPIILDDLMLS